jgi:hypothetical protein
MAVGDLTTLSAVEAWIGVASDSGGPIDTLLSALIGSASQYVKSWLNRDILSASYTERYRGNGGETLLLANGPVTGVASVAWRGAALTVAGDPVAGTSGFYFDGAGRVLSLQGYCFPRGELVQVSYTAGYASAPADVQQAVNELVGETYRRRDRIGQSSKSLGGQETISFSQLDMNASVKTLLAQYKALTPVATY